MNIPSKQEVDPKYYDEINLLKINDCEQDKRPDISIWLPLVIDRETQKANSSPYIA